MDKIYIFDVDGTLTPSRQPMTKEFQKFFKQWIKKNKFYLVTGSDLLKLQEQMCYFDINAEVIFTCGGNKLYTEGPTQQWPRDWRLIYENKFEPCDSLIKYLEDTLDDSDYPVKAGIHIEDRGSMLNFSMVGRKCTLQERKNYFEYDKLTGEREKIADYINDNFKDLSAVIGGQISIDIAPKGNDKSQVIEKIKNRNIVTSRDNYVFIGDRTMEGGNDYPLAKVMGKMDNCEVFQAGEPSAENGYKRTREILEELND